MSHGYQGRLFGSATILIVLTAASGALGQDRKTETAAQGILAKAREWYASASYEQAVPLLEKARRACTPERCTAETRAAIRRDLGAFQLQRGDEDAAGASFAEALALEPSSEPHAAYDSAELRLAWATAKDEASVSSATQPNGDFAHTPATEQTARTSLPIYLEYAGSARLTQVIVKYKGTGMAAYRQMRLPRLGNGWGGLIPCADVRRGVMRYYALGLDAEGEPAATTGDTRQPFFVRIKTTIAGEPPRLPNGRPPVPCGESAAAESASEVAKDTAESARSSTDPLPFARFWVGVAGSIDLVTLSSANDVCKVGQGSGYYCTTPSGADYPSSSENDGLAPGKAGQSSGGIVPGNVRVMLALDYAFTANILFGTRIGYVSGRYPGSAGIRDGKAFSIPLHVEARGTYVFGDNALAHTGFFPYAFAAGGVSEFDASNKVQVTQSGVVGQRPMLAWASGGPAFLALGAGARYGLSPRAAFTAGLKLTGAFGPGGFLPTMAPEMALQYGF